MNILLVTEDWSESKGGVQDYLKNIEKHLGVARVFVAGKKKMWKRPRWLWEARKALKEAKSGGFDAVLCGKALFEGRVGLYLKKKLNIPYVVFTYAMEIETWVKQPRQKRLLGKVLRGADRVTYINEQTKRTLISLGLMENQLVKVWPGVSERFFKEVANDLISGTLEHYAVQQPYVLCVARLVSRKGIDTLIEAFARLDQTKFGNWQLVIAGDGPQSRDLKELAESEFINKSVSFLTNVPDKHLPALYSGAGLFAMTPKELPGDYEGFGIVYIEAAACGVPSLGTSTGGVPEAVVDGETGLIAEPDNVQSVKDKLEKLIESEDLRNRMGSAAKERAWKNFRWSDRIRPLLEELERLKKEASLEGRP